MTKQDIIIKYISPIIGEIIQPEFEEHFLFDPDTKIFGGNGILDSMGLLHLVVLLEEKIAKGTGKQIRLVSSAAMSQTKSPFRTVDSLADYVVELLGMP